MKREGGGKWVRKGVKDEMGGLSRMRQEGKWIEMRVWQSYGGQVKTTGVLRLQKPFLINSQQTE